ncbi:M16 family metallopeptidase [Francisella frigiditurris]|uniref:Insulinase family protein n=1 Tax=Francisella frigiditurris TaxID=1542390 RepID=A0A1J0KSN2_9GAMM|nr:pitrilysin family protein [Francisella frigiditurris]APC96636.1 insulinase family protein [Francisella frigiditurris]
MLIHKYKLKNGLEIYIKQDNRAPVVLSQIWYKVGSTYEPKGLTGISHMLEHMMFKGTDKYSKEDMNSLVENNGGIQNAFTSFDFTAYYQFWHKKNLDLSLSIESSRMSNLKFDENEFFPENKVVIEERCLRIEDKPFNYAFEQFMKLAYQDNSRHIPIIGWMDDIKNYKLNDLKNWYQANYAPNNAAIVLVGDIDPDEAYEKVKANFENIKESIVSEPKKEKSILNIGYRHKSIKRSPNDIDNLILGYITPSLTTEYEENDPFALMILNNILGDADASILQKEMVRDTNYCCHVDTEYSPFIRGEDIFIITAIANETFSLKLIQNKIEEILDRLKKEGITLEQLNRAKVTIKSDKVFSMDSLETQANLIGSLACVGLDVDYYKYIDKLYDVTISDVNRVLNKFFNKENLTSLYLKKD